MKHTIDYKDSTNAYHQLHFNSLKQAKACFDNAIKHFTNVNFISYIQTTKGNYNTFQLIHVIDDTTPYIASVSNRWIPRKPIDLQASLVIHV
jgi:hypothetical protein